MPQKIDHPQVMIVINLIELVKKIDQLIPTS